MTYVRKTQTVVPVEHARRLNAALRLELASLTSENAVLAPKVETMRRDVTAARKKLARQIRDLDAIRAQISNIAALAEHVVSGGPVYGGPDGLQAAADEIKAHGEAGLNLTKGAGPRKGPSHGTGRKYALGCRCVECRAWRKRKSARERTNVKRRLEQAVAEALRAA
jgi:outer membrane murein-binding lipoprotein Lpp